MEDGGEEEEGEQLGDTNDRGEEGIMGSVHALMHFSFSFYNIIPGEQCHVQPAVQRCLG